MNGLLRRWSYVAALLSFLISGTAGTGNTTCASTQLDWYVSIAGESPCITYQRLRQICNRDYEVPTMRTNTPGDNCDDQQMECCCNSVSWALSMLCMNCQLDTQPGNAIGIDAGVGAYQMYLTRSDGTMCSPNTNSSLPTSVLSAVCNENMHIANFVYNLFWSDGSWFYVYSKEAAEADQAANNNHTFGFCPGQNSTTTSSSSTTSSSTSTSSSGSSSSGSSSSSSSLPIPLDATVTSTSSASSTTSPQKSTSNLGAIVGGAVGGGLGLLIIVLISILLLRRNSKSQSLESTDFYYGTRDELPTVIPFPPEQERAVVMTEKNANETTRFLVPDSALQPSSSVAGTSSFWVVPRSIDSPQSDSQGFRGEERAMSIANGSVLGTLPPYEP